MDREQTTITFSGQKLLNLNAALKSVLNLKGVKFGMAVARIMEAIAHEITILEKAIEPKEDYAAYKKACEEAAMPYWETQNGQQLLEVRGFNTRPKIKETDTATFQTLHAEIAAKFAEAIADRAVQCDEYKKALQEPVTILINPIDRGVLPKEITLYQVVGLLPVISTLTVPDDKTKPLVLTNKQLLEFHSGVMGLIGGHTSPKFTVAMIENLRVMLDTYDRLIELPVIKRMEDEYEVTRIKTMELYAALDAYNTPKQTYNPATGQSGYSIENLSKFNKEMAGIEKSYSALLKQYNELAKADVTLTMHTVAEDDLPEDMSGEACKLLSAIIV